MTLRLQLLGRHGEASYAASYRKWASEILSCIAEHNERLDIPFKEACVWSTSSFIIHSRQLSKIRCDGKTTAFNKYTVPDEKYTSHPYAFFLCITKIQQHSKCNRGHLGFIWSNHGGITVISTNYTQIRGKLHRYVARTWTESERSCEDQSSENTARKWLHTVRDDRQPSMSTT